MEDVDTKNDLADLEVNYLAAANKQSINQSQVYGDIINEETTQEDCNETHSMVLDSQKPQANFDSRISLTHSKSGFRQRTFTQNMRIS